jgi:hypothetical protein
MRFSPDPHIRAIQVNCVNSRRAWMSHARVFAGVVFTYDKFRKAKIRDAIAHARRASRSSWQINK